MTNALDVLLPGPSGPPEGVTLRFGVVTQVSPLMVRLERDADPSYVNATCVAVDALDAQFGTPVLVAKSGDRLIITNRLGDPDRPGMLRTYAGNDVPPGYLECDGSLQSVAAYPALAGRLGTRYGGNGVSTFGIPNLKGRTIVGVDVADASFDTVGEIGGAKAHTLTAAEMPTHNHSASTSGTYSGGALQGSEQLQYGGLAAGSLYFVGGAGNKSGTASFSTSVGDAGSGGAHNNLQPYMVLRILIKT